MSMASHNAVGSTGPIGASTKQLNGLAARDNETAQMSSAEQGREGCDPGNPRSSRAFSSDRRDLVHELANTTTAVLMNAQVLGWKLPSYRRLKRPLREIERNAQRGGELIKRLLSQLATERSEQAIEDGLGEQGPGLGLANTVTAQEPGVDSGRAVNLPPRMNAHPAPVFSSATEDELTSPCDACTSMFPKKG
jgi:hypothetical protein